MSSRDRPRRRAATVTVVVAAGVAGALGAGWSPVAAGPAGGATVAIVDQSFGVTAGQPFTATVSLGDAAPPADAVLAVSVHPALTSPDDLAGEFGTASDTVELPVATLSDSALEVPTALGAPVAGDATLQMASAGVHPVTLTMSSGGAVVAATTTFVAVADPAGGDPRPLSLAVVAAIADPGPWPDGDDTSVAALGSLIELADAVDAPLSLRLPPAVAALVSPQAPAPDGSLLPDVSIPGSVPDGPEPTAPDGTAAGGDVADVALADRFDGDELLTTPFLDVDPSALIAVGEGALFAEQLRDGENVLAAAVPLGDSTREAWLSSRPISRAAASQLRTLGVRMLVFPPEVAESLGVDVDPVAGAAFDIVLADGEHMPALVVSPRGSSLAAAADGTTAAATAARLLAEVLLSEVARGRGAVALGAAGLTPPDPAVTARLAAYAGQLPSVDVVPLSSLTGTVSRAVAGPAVELPETAGLDLSGRLSLIEAARVDAARAESMLVDPAPARRWDAEFDRMLSSAVDDGVAGTHLSAVADEVDSILGAIVPPEPFTFTLTGTSSRLPFTVENTSPYDLNVVVRVSSAKLQGETTTQLLPAASSTDLKIPVRARSNGSFSVELTFYPPSGPPRLTDAVVLKANVTRLSGVSQFVTGGALLALASWWFSHYRKSRAARRQAGDDAAS